MKILLLGAEGQLGFELRGSLGCIGSLTALGRAECDLARPESLEQVVRAYAPDLLVNAAAYTDVDGSEAVGSPAHAINGAAVAELGRLAKAERVGLIHGSTDGVFDGEARAPYREDDATAPVNAYGVSKLAGEQALKALEAPAIVLRTAWVYGLRRKSFVATIVRLASERSELSVVDDQFGNPTFCRDLSNGIAAIATILRPDPFGAATAHRGVYHLAGSGVASRSELAKLTVERHPRRETLKVRTLSAIPSDAMPLPARRPLRTPLDCSKVQRTFGVALPDWRDALERALASL